MAMAYLEHANITVSDIERTSKMLCDLFDWKVRWKGQPGEAKNGGVSWHVGGDESYVAVYSWRNEGAAENTYTMVGGLNHLGVVVDDLDLVERRVLDMGIETYSHGDYEPGRRFYFRDHDGIEIEVVSYQ